MKKHVFFALVVISVFCNAQEKIPLIDYEEITSLVTQASQDGDNEKVLELLNKVSENDSTYCSVLISKSYYLLNLKKYDEAIEVTNQGLKNNCLDSNLSFYINKGLAYINQDNYQEAINVYNKALETFPQNYKLWYNKGVALEYNGDLNNAIEAYKKTILLNPAYRKPHLQLGNICYKQELMAQALMCWNMYLLLEPDAEGAFNTLKSLNNIVKAKNENEANSDLQISADDEYFEDIDLVLSNKIALNENYTTGNKINIALTKQNHALLAQLKEFDGDGGFWDTKYVPFYQWITEKNLFNQFIYTLTYSIENEKYKKIVEKNEKDIISFVEVFNEKWRDILKHNTIVYEGQSQAITYNYYNSYVEGLGRVENNKSVGNWKFYNSDGQLSANGFYNDSGVKHGKWTWFFKDGSIKEAAIYNEGKLNGEYFQNHVNGKPYIESSYLNDKLDGEYRYYNNNGALIQKKYYENGELEGLYQSYFLVGEKLVEFYIPYKNGSIDKKVIEYYANGDVYSEMDYLNGKRDGLEKKYHFNKNLSAEISYEAGKLEGSYKTYHTNNNVFEIGQSLDNFYHGPWKTYHYDGTLQSEFNYNNGSLDGVYKYYDNDGKIHYEYLYRKGEIIAYKFYNKQNKIIKEARKKGGEFNYTGYSPQGNITSEGLYNVSGGKKGKWKFYSSNGVLYEEGNYIDNKANGENKIYYKNGNLQSVASYENDSIKGYFKDFHKNGKLKSQGWYKNNSALGEWRSYYLDGTLEAINYYHKGKYHGNQKYYSENGKLINEYKYSYGELISETTFDKESKPVNYFNYKKDPNNLLLKFKHYNSTTSTEVSFINGLKHGAYNYYNYYGVKTSKGNYTNGEQDGEWIWYNEDGKTETRRGYLNGNLNGETINYFEDGSVESKSYYEYGKSSGAWTSFHDNGNKSILTNYQNDELHGRKEFYSYSGKLQLIRFYNHGRLIGYSYLDKSSKELPMIKIKNETAKIKAYFDNGKVSRELEYKNGDLINDYSIYYYSGQLENKTSYSDNSYNGLDIKYYQNGKVKKEETYVYDNLHGTVKEYYKSGKLKSEINYLNNNKTGEANYYNELGKLEKKELYFDGDIYSSETY